MDSRPWGNYLEDYRPGLKVVSKWFLGFNQVFSRVSKCLVGFCKCFLGFSKVFKKPLKDPQNH